MTKSIKLLKHRNNELQNLNIELRASLNASENLVIEQQDTIKMLKDPNALCRQNTPREQRLSNELVKTQRDLELFKSIVKVLINKK